MAGGGEKVTAPVWAILLGVSILGGAAAIVWRGGVMSDKLDHLTQAVETVGARSARVEEKVNDLGARTQVLEALRGVQATTAASRPPSP